MLPDVLKSHFIYKSTQVDLVLHPTCVPEEVGKTKKAKIKNEIPVRHNEIGSG
jgi:hypothetical protein